MSDGGVKHESGKSIARVFARNLHDSCPRSVGEALSTFWSGALAGLALEAGVHGTRVLYRRHQEVRRGRPLGSLNLKWWITAVVTSVTAPKSPYQGALGTLAAGGLWSGIFGFVYVPMRSAVDATMPADQPGWGPALAAAAGSLASSSVRVPLQVVKVRMARHEFFCSLQAFERIIVREGPTSLYSGWARSVAQNLPFDSMLFFLYDWGKTRLIATRQRRRDVLHHPPTEGGGPESPGPCTATTGCSQARGTGALSELGRAQATQEVRQTTDAVQNQVTQQQLQPQGSLAAPPEESPLRGAAVTARISAAAGAETTGVTASLTDASSSSPSPPTADAVDAMEATTAALPYAFGDAVMVGGAAGAAAGLLTSPVEAAWNLASRNHRSSRPAAHSPAEAEALVPPRRMLTGTAGATAHTSQGLTGGGESLRSAGLRDAGGGGGVVGRIRRVLGGRSFGLKNAVLPGGLTSRVAWAAFEGALFFPALETAIPLCDWLFTTAGSSNQEQLENFT